MDSESYKKGYWDAIDTVCKKLKLNWGHLNNYIDWEEKLNFQLSEIIKFAEKNYDESKKTRDFVGKL